MSSVNYKKETECTFQHMPSSLADCHLFFHLVNDGSPVGLFIKVFDDLGVDR